MQTPCQIAIIFPENSKIPFRMWSIRTGVFPRPHAAVVIITLVCSRESFRRRADKNLPPHPTLSPANPAARGGGEGVNESADCLNERPHRRSRFENTGVANSVWPSTRHEQTECNCVKHALQIVEIPVFCLIQHDTVVWSHPKGPHFSGDQEV